MEFEISRMFKALGDPTRLRIFEFLAGQSGPVALAASGAVRPVCGATVGDVCCHVTGADKFSSTVSHHIRELRLAGVVCAERRGKTMVCRVRPEALAALSNYFATIPGRTDPCCEDPV